MPVKDSRGSGAIAEFPHPLVLVFSSLKDRSSPRDPLVSHGQRASGRISPRGQDKSIFLLISITSQFLCETHAKSKGRFVLSRIINPIRPWKYRSESRVSRRAIYIALDVKRECYIWLPNLVRDPLYCKSPRVFRSGPLFVHGAIWRQRLVPAIVIAIFRSCFRMHIYIFRGRRYARQYAVFTGRWAHHRPDSK